MNKKGFAVSGILYTILLIFLAVIYMLLMNFKNKKNLLDQLKSEVEFNSKLCEEKIGHEYTFDYTGEAQEFIAECEGEYKVELWGASGGATRREAATGYGGYTSGKITLSKMQKLYVYVGQVGESTGDVNKTPSASYNGGGAGANSNYSLSSSGSQYVSASGGGATDIRYFGGETPTEQELLWNNATGLKNRIMVAAGGGGSAYARMSTNTPAGGPGGGLLGANSGEVNGGAHMAGATGATQTTGGITSQSLTYGSQTWIQGNNGTFGIGGDGKYNTHPGGGGGGGYYGGASGGSGGASVGGAGGSGGSAYISGHDGSLAITSSESLNIKTGCNNLTNENSLECSRHFSGLYFTDTVMIDGSGYSWTTEKGSEVVGMPTHDGTSTMTGNTGDGYAKITYLGKKKVKKCNVSAGTEFTFEYVGDEQEFMVPCDGYYKVELWGAQGGNAKYSTQYYGGLGGYTSGSINLKKNNSLYIYVGGQGVGHAGTSTDTITENGNGYNSGKGAGAFYASNSNGGGGGGATDVRLVDGEWDDFDSLKSRIMVAGGGGGADSHKSAPSYSGNGGAGGGLTGYDADKKGSCYNYGAGGTQTAGGSSVRCSSSTGVATYTTGYFGSNNEDLHTGGGGGYYGGGNGSHTSAGGGSSFISGHDGCDAINGLSTSSSIIHTGQSMHYSGSYFIDTKIIDGQGYEWTTTKAATSTGMPNYDGTDTIIGNSGNGYAKITYLGECPVAVGTEYTFDYTGSEQLFKPLCTGNYKVELWGAQGGGASSNQGGKGSYTSGNVSLSKNDNIYVYVGERKSDGSAAYNGGAQANGSGTDTTISHSGGGATDVRFFGANYTPSSSDLAWDSDLGLNSRIMVAAGGGGFEAWTKKSMTADGGAGGGLTGYNGSYIANGTSGYPTGGTQVSGGIGDKVYWQGQDGSFGVGGAGETRYYGGGGGSGYYGGGGGGNSNHISSGAGGSSYISGHAGSLAIAEGSTAEPRTLKNGCTNSSTSFECSIHYSNLYFINTKMIDGAGYSWTNIKGSLEQMPNPAGNFYTSGSGHTGNGYAKITYLGNN